MKHAARLALLALAATALTPAWGAAEGYALWDDFTGATELDLGKWLGSDRIRMRDNGAFRFLQRDRGSQADNTGTSNSTWGANLKNPAAVTQMRAVVTVNGFGVTACAANTAPGIDSAAQARLAGAFFNAGPGVPTTRINDIGAAIRFIRFGKSVDGAGLLRVQGVVFQCTTEDCNTGTATLGSVDLGTATAGQTLTLKFDWEPANDRFNFYRNSDPVARVSYAGLDDSQAPFVVYRQIGTRTFASSCLTGPRTEAWIDASFDNLSVNASAAP